MFIPAGELRKRFYTEGVFYRLNVEDTDYECRGLARIMRKGVLSEEADALIVMVNPGSCKPADNSFVYPLYVGNLFEIPFVRAKEDPTQYQLMRLMERMQWDMIYIINLSDLRAGNIDEFRRLRGTLIGVGYGEHSIFSENRRGSIQRLVSGSTRVIAAWGKERFIRDDAIKAHGYLSNLIEIEGLLAENIPFYRHPNPMLKVRCIKWLDDMCEALKEKVEA